MKEMKPAEKLKTLILEKERQHLEEELELKESFNTMYETLKPINLIKNTLSEAFTSPDIRHNLFNAVIGMSTGFVAKKLLIRNPNGMIKSIEGSVLQLLVAAKVTNNADEIRSVIKTIFHKLISWKKSIKPTEEIE